MDCSKHQDGPNMPDFPDARGGSTAVANAYEGEKSRCQQLNRPQISWVALRAPTGLANLSLYSNQSTIRALPSSTSRRIIYSVDTPRFASIMSR
jgi:hypothetical protein